MLPIHPIIAAAAANILVGVAIYSKYTFGPLWSKVSGKKVVGLKNMPIRFALEVVSSVMTAAALYIAIMTFKKAEVASDNMFTHIYAWFFQDMAADMMSSLKIAGFLWLGFMVPHVICHVAWDESMNWRKGALKAIFSLIHILAMAAAISHFA